MELEQTLEQLGLNNKEAKVYLALLQLGTATVPRISQLAGTKRPTTYLILDDLRKRGLVVAVPRGATAYFTAESPEKLLEAERKKHELIESTLPGLLAIFNAKKEKPQVRFYRGAKGVEEVYTEITHSAEVLMYGSIETIEGGLPGITEQVPAQLDKRKVKVREIIEASPGAQAYLLKNQGYALHQTRLAPSPAKLPTDNMIYGNKLAIFSYKDEPMVVVIESSDVAVTYRSMFELVWHAIGKK